MGEIIPWRDDRITVRTVRKVCFERGVHPNDFDDAVQAVLVDLHELSKTGQFFNIIKAAKWRLTDWSRLHYGRSQNVRRIRRPDLVDMHTCEALRFQSHVDDHSLLHTVDELLSVCSTSEQRHIVQRLSEEWTKQEIADELEVHPSRISQHLRTLRNRHRRHLRCPA